jgi:hypothetical protein
MKEHAVGFKWRETIEEQILEQTNENLPPTIERPKVSNEKLQIYNKFKNLHTSWEISEKFLISPKIEHITYLDIEYKYCRLCSSWCKVSDFYKCSSKHDGLDTRCISCFKNQRSAASTSRSLNEQ